MVTVRWTPQATEDLESIIEFIADDSPHYAQLFAINSIKAVERLWDFPDLGRIVPEFDDPDIREILLGNYRIVYRIQKGSVEILTIYHGSRILDPSKLK